MSEGFLGRWAKRKEAVRKGEAVPAEPVKEAPPPSPQPSPAGGRGSEAAPQGASASPQVEQGPAAEPPPPTLEDVQHLTPQSDFSRFARADVDPAVKNAAMKKLFADPRFNVMDGLDVYIDDYSKPTPIPPALLKQLASAQFLKLFDEAEDQAKPEAEPDKAPTAREGADAAAGESVAQSGTATPAVPPAEDHADPDLRLQQDHAAGPEGPGQGPR